MSTINYSKWDHIEISDDEDDTHPNIDTPSLFRWRHQARVERMEETKKKKEVLEKEKHSHQQKMSVIKQKLKGAEANSGPDEESAAKDSGPHQPLRSKDADQPTSVAAEVDIEKLKLEESELEKQEAEFLKKEDELDKEERLTPWNIDTICHEGKSKTLINKVAPAPKDLTDEERAEKQHVFSKKYKTEIRKFGMMHRYDDGLQFLQEHPELVCEETANYLVIWCIDLQVDEKHELMKHVSHQTIVMQFILELARSLEQDPRSCVRAFFSRIKMAEKQYMDAFNDELNSFRERVKGRAQARIEEAMKEYEEEEREKRLGPGGLDPVEVMESLPEVLQKCFESQDIGMLQQAVLEMPKEEAEHHIKRCIDSGLWVPNAADAAAAAAAAAGNTAEQEDEDDGQSEGATGGSGNPAPTDEDEKYEEVD